MQRIDVDLEQFQADYRRLGFNAMTRAYAHIMRPSTIAKYARKLGLTKAQKRPLFDLPTKDGQRSDAGKPRKPNRFRNDPAYQARLSAALSELMSLPRYDNTVYRMPDRNKAA